MTPQLSHITSYMEARGRIVRLQPATGLPNAERYSQVERVVDSLWAVARDLGISLGTRPTLILTGDGMAPPPTMLASLTALETEALATFIMCGLGDAHSQAVWKFASTPLGKPSPNYRIIIDDVYGQDVVTTEEED